MLNALSTALIEQLEAAQPEAAADPTVGAVVLTGAGGRAFCTGMDLEERTGMTASAIARQRRRLIAAVAGAAMGDGFELALCCDLLVASEDARFAPPGVRVGVMPAAATRLVPGWSARPAPAT